ncbi:MAG: M48 family metalloprotease [Gammaproteobacteria bacterium]|nr:M48 family metalloprotease [Gammaproteobacteria bacterium]
MQLAPFQYHNDVCTHLKRNEPGLWQWFVSDNFSTADAEHSKLELLKSCYRMGAESHADLYQIAREVAERLEIDFPITLYQAQSAGASPNAALYFFDDELCVVLSGAIDELLDAAELRSLFGHEFSHHRLYTANNGEFFAASRLLMWCAQQPDCHEAYVETARRFQLQTELYADKGGAFVCENATSAMSSLIKVSTGLKTVAVDDYVEQAQEVLSKDDTGSDGLTHPEIYLRVKALHDGMNDPADYSRLVRGKLDSGRLDILDQRELATLTHNIVQTIGYDERFRSDEHTVLMREYYPSFKWDKIQRSVQVLRAPVADASELTHSYLAYLLLDLATADRDDSYPLLGPMLHFAESLGVHKILEATARKELKLRKSDTDKAMRNAEPAEEEADRDG